jgi:hypothetical protein
LRPWHREVRLGIEKYKDYRLDAVKATIETNFSELKQSSPAAKRQARQTSGHGR